MAAISSRENRRLMIESLTGQLLVASSLVKEPMYASGVCLVVHQDDENVIGVMLNRPIKPTPAMLLELLSKASTNDESAEATDALDYDEPGPPAGSNRLPDTALPREGGGIESLRDSPLAMLHFGGPNSGPVVAIHQDFQQAEAETGEGIYMAAQKQHLENLVRDPKSTYRLIVGHLAWKPEQLEHEIAAGVWHRVPATLNTVFSSHEEMWPGIIRRATSNSMSKWLGIPDAKGMGELN